MKDLECVKYHEDCLSDIDFGSRWLIYQIKQQSSTIYQKGTQSAEQPSYLYELVKHDYKRNSRIEHFMNPSQSFSIEQSYINLAIVETKDQQKKENQLRGAAPNKMVIDTYEEIYRTKTRINIKDFFKACKNNVKKVLVFGRAGIGKSTFCRYVAHQWASGKIWSEYDLVALIPLRSLTGQHYPPNRQYDLIDVLKITCFCWCRQLSEKDNELLKQQVGKSRILWVLDGYDEIVQSTPMHLQHLLDQLLRTPYHIVTSRPYLNNLAYEVCMEIIGFIDENIPVYIARFFSQVETESSSTLDEKNKLLNFIKLNPSIWGIAHIPLNLELICSVWSNTDWTATEAMTITILYGKLSVWICRRYLEKQKQKSANEINMMDQQEVYDDCQNEMAFLETLAFLGMEQNAIVLRPELLAKARKESKCSFRKDPHLLNIGLLKSFKDRGIGTKIEADKDHYFVHLSFQGYFAARYLINALHHGPREKVIEFIQHQKYNRRFNLLFRFSSGLAVQTKCNETVTLFWDTLLGDPVDLIGIRHMQLVMTCFDEVAHNLDFPYQTLFLRWVQDWMKTVIQSQNPVLQDHLATTLKHCISITKQSIIRTTFNQFLGQDDRLKQHIPLKYTYEPHHIDPLQPFSSAIINQLRISVTATREAYATSTSSPRNSETATAEIDHLVMALQDENLNVRRSACEAVGKTGDTAGISAVIDVLVVALEDQDWELRRAACDALGRIGEKAATSAVIDHLVIALGDENSVVRWSAYDAVGRLGETTETTAMLSRLVMALGDRDWEVRRAACEAVGRIGEQAGTSALINRLVIALGDENPEVRWSACDALGRIGAKAGISAVIDRLVIAGGDENPVVRWSAFDALGRLGAKAGPSAVIDRLVSAFKDDDWKVRRTAREAICCIGEKTGTTAVLDHLLIALEDQNSNVRRSGWEAIRRIGEKAGTSAVIDRLVIALDDENPEVRWSACEAVGNIGDKTGTNAIIDLLLIALKDQDWKLRTMACGALGRIGEKAGISAVIDRLFVALGDENPVVRWSACDALGTIGEKAGTSAVIDRLIIALRDENPNVRRNACEAVGKIGDKGRTSAILELLLVALKDQDCKLRTMACDALGRVAQKIGASAVIDHLVVALGDQNLNVRRSACEAVGKIGDTAGTSAIIDVLVVALEDQDWELRRAACDALGRIGEKAATGVVIDCFVIALGDENPEVRWSACDAVGRIGEKVGTTAVVDHLVIVLGDQDWEVKKRACEALGRIGEKAGTSAVIDQLVTSLGDRDSYVRRSACEALGSIGKKAGTITVIHAVLSAMQREDVRSGSWYEKALRSLLGLSNVDPSGNIAVALFRRSWSGSEVCQFYTIWLASMAFGYGITLRGNMIHIYAEEEPETLKEVESSKIAEFLKVFVKQREKYFDSGQWNALQL